MSAGTHQSGLGGSRSASPPRKPEFTRDPGRLRWDISVGRPGMVRCWSTHGRQNFARRLRVIERPESCVCRRTTFHKYGVRTLLFSKFVIGLDALAGLPLTGADRTAPVRFLIFDGIGAALWSGAYTAVGYAFSNQLDRVAIHLARIGFATTAVIAAIFIYNLLRRFARWERFVPRVQTCKDYSGGALRKTASGRRSSHYRSSGPSRPSRRRTGHSRRRPN